MGNPAFSPLRVDPAEHEARVRIRPAGGRTLYEVQSELRSKGLYELILHLLALAPVHRSAKFVRAVNEPRRLGDEYLGSPARSIHYDTS